jgi:2,3-bisphosphoglycerate-independent phosphoglycerate mutase
MQALEEIDRHIVAPLHAALRTYGAYRILVSPDHPTPVSTKTHSHGYVPWTMAGAGIEPDASSSYGESSAGESPHVLPHGHELMSRFIVDA